MPDDGFSLKPKNVEGNKNYINVVVGDVLFTVIISQQDIMNKDTMHLTALTCRKSALFQFNVFVFFVFFFFLSLNPLIGWQLSIWIGCRPFSSLLYNYQLLCFWRLALSIAVEVVPRPFSRILLLQECLLQTRYV